MEPVLIARLAGACVVIALLLGGLASIAARLGAARIAGGRAGGRFISLVETTYLPGAAALHVVRIVGRYYVVGGSTASLAAICEIPAEDVVRARDGTAPGMDVLARAARVASDWRRRCP